jgi:uncharacterized RDD family membrane protein YckC
VSSDDVIANVIYRTFHNYSFCRGIIFLKGGVIMEPKFEDMQWFYVKDNQKKGPINESEIQVLFNQGFLDGETLVWSRNLEGWEKASNHFLNYILNPPPFTSHSKVHNYITVENKIEEGYYPKGRPWIRYLAKMFDFALYAFIIWFIIGIFSPNFLYGITEIALTFLTLFMCIIIETLVLIVFGNTPGRAILKTKIKTLSGEKIYSTQAISRSFGLWVRGLGIGLPLITLICLIVAVSDLRGRGITNWDQKNNLVTTHGKVGFIRVFLTAVTVIFVTVWGYI